MNKTFLIIGAILLGMLGWSLGVKSWQPTREQLVEARDKAIETAVEKGDYRCCIEPACTMCFWEANEWNNHTAGTCACDDLIAAGKEPCPQCKNGLCKKNSDGVCQIKGLTEEKNGEE